MSYQPSDVREAIVICTRNRSSDVEQTLRSITAQSGAAERLVLIVDGSDPEEATQTVDVLGQFKCEMPCHYHRYSEPPAHTRQRNAAIDLLPDSVEIVHFIDDDVSLRTDYFNHLTRTLREHTSLLGVGGLIVESNDAHSPAPPSWSKRFFLLGDHAPSSVLPSGQTTPTQSIAADFYPAEWLSTCSSSYRRSVFENHSFDASVEGPSPTLHDLDFSYRVAQEGPLAVVPEAICFHRRSQDARRDVQSTSSERVAKRYWFVRKNMNRPLYRLAFWWSVLGKVLAHVFSTHPDSNPALKGLLDGIQRIWTRTHPLLRPDD